MVFYQKPILFPEGSESGANWKIKDKVINYSHGLGRVAEWDSMSTPHWKVPTLNPT